jgi:hypothetical protein
MTGGLMGGHPLGHFIDMTAKPVEVTTDRPAWRPTDAPAFGAEYADQITEAVRQITRWIDEQVEAGATDHLVSALRTKGYTVTPPPDPAACPRGIPACPLPPGHEHYSRTDEEIATYQETAARRRLGETVRDVERREQAERERPHYHVWSEGPCPDGAACTLGEVLS